MNHPRFSFLSILLTEKISLLLSINIWSIKRNNIYQVAFGEYIYLLKIDDVWFILLLDHSRFFSLWVKRDGSRDDCLRFRASLNCLFFSKTHVFNYEASKLTYIYCTVNACILSSLSCSNCLWTDVTWNTFVQLVECLKFVMLLLLLS